YYTPFLFTYPAPTELYTLSLHDALPISCSADCSGSQGAQSRSRSPRPHVADRADEVHDRQAQARAARPILRARLGARAARAPRRSEEHTSELQSLAYLVCRLLLEKKKKK